MAFNSPREIHKCVMVYQTAKKTVSKLKISTDIKSENFRFHIEQRVSKFKAN